MVERIYCGGDDLYIENPYRNHDINPKKGGTSRPSGILWVLCWLGFGGLFGSVRYFAVQLRSARMETKTCFHKLLEDESRPSWLTASSLSMTVTPNHDSPVNHWLSKYTDSPSECIFDDQQLYCFIDGLLTSVQPS